MYRSETMSQAKKNFKPQKKQVEASTLEFHTGRLKDYVENWRKITPDENTLDIVQHCHIEFMQGEDPSSSYCFRGKFCEHKNNIMSKEIEYLLKM